jgi:hypothetical protein
VVIVGRHGIRTPFPLPGGTGAYSKDNREWFDTGATPFPAEVPRPIVVVKLVSFDLHVVSAPSLPRPIVVNPVMLIQMWF